MKLIEGAWANQPAYLVGGGPSLKAFDWSLLEPKKNIIVVNRAWKDVPHADIFFTEDHRVISELWGHAPEWKAWKGLKVLHALDPKFREEALAVDPTLHVIDRNGQSKFWSHRFEDGLSYSSNSMIGALNVAFILGANPIYLLGVDCRSDGAYMPNYHADYPKDWATSSSQAEAFASDFTHWAALHLKKRIVVNLVNPDCPSALECWPKVPWVEVL